MDAYREKQLMERITKLEEEIERLKNKPWTHDFSGMNGYVTTDNTNTWNWNNTSSTYTVTS
jgi:hypothetical protein